VKGFLAALGLLTIIRVPGASADGDSIARGAPWFPIVGLVIGAALAGTDRLLGGAPPHVAATLVVVLWATLTGFLHLDGTADSCDALIASVPRERRLEIIRDPRIGAFGAAGLMLLLLLKVEGLASIQRGASAAALFIAPSLARWAVLAAARQPLARPGGMAAALRPGATLPVAIGSAAVPAALLVFLGLEAPLAPILAAVLGLAAAGAIVLAARSRMGGVTGDILGFLIEATEAGVIVAFALAPARGVA
jgi:adenosylcobinamide-GDP ribazoletransferase